jgi:hypothetical protein
MPIYLRTGHFLAIIGVLTMAATGCSSNASGTPRPDSSAERVLPGESEEDIPEANSEPSAPRVDRPLDASWFLAQPCAVLDKSQLGPLGVSRRGIPTTSGAVADYAGPFCSWHANPELGSTIGVGFITGNKNGLSDMYRGRDRFEDFRPVEVDGYPAVFANGPDLRANGTCNVAVGVSDTLMIRASEQGRLDAQGACDRAAQVASSALTTIRGGQ